MSQPAEAKRLLTEIEAFLAPCPTCGCKRIAASYFGLQSVGASHLVDRLRGGGDIRHETATRVRAFMKDHK